MDATVGDTEFWLLAKRVVASGGSVASGDTVFSLQAKLTNLMGTGGGGGGTDLGAVQKTGDTMTGTLEIADPTPNGGLKIDWTGGANQKLLINDAPNGRYVSIDCHLIAIRENGTALLGTGNWGPGGSSGMITLSVGCGIDLGLGQANEATLAIDVSTGDILITAKAGPNAGKSVNLTAGKWA